MHENGLHLDIFVTRYFGTTKWSVLYLHNLLELLKTEKTKGEMKRGMERVMDKSNA